MQMMNTGTNLGMEHHLGDLQHFLVAACLTEPPIAWALHQRKHDKALFHLFVTALGVVLVILNVAKANTCLKLNCNLWHKSTHEAMKSHC